MNDLHLQASVKLTTDQLTDHDLCAVYNHMTAGWPLPDSHSLFERVHALFTEPDGKAHPEVTRIVGKLVMQRHAVNVSDCP